MFRKQLYKIDWKDQYNRKSNLFRLWINLWYCIGFNFFPLPTINRLGITFWRKEDELTYIFRWKRTDKSKPWLSLNACNVFSTLKDIDIEEEDVHNFLTECNRK